jgi:hypothetical protein
MYSFKEKRNIFERMSIQAAGKVRFASDRDGSIFDTASQITALEEI